MVLPCGTTTKEPTQAMLHDARLLTFVKDQALFSANGYPTTSIAFVKPRKNVVLSKGKTQFLMSVTGQQLCNSKTELSSG